MLETSNTWDSYRLFVIYPTCPTGGLLVWSCALQGSREEWMLVFFICAGFYVFSTFVYALLASGVEQPWAKSDDTQTAESDKMTTQL